MPRVFVVNPPIQHRGRGIAQYFDMSTAEEFGRLVMLLPPGWPPADVRELYAALRDGMADYADDDYVLPCGDMTAIVMTVALAVARVGAGGLRWLEWQRDDKLYLPRDLGSFVNHRVTQR